MGRAACKPSLYSFCSVESDASNWEQAQGKGTISRCRGQSLYLDTVTWSQTLGLPLSSREAEQPGDPLQLPSMSHHRACTPQAATGPPVHGTPPHRAAKALTCLTPHPASSNLLLSMPLPIPRTSTRALTLGRGEPPALATSTPPPTAARACPPPSQGPPTISTAQVRISAVPPGWAKLRTPSGAGPLFLPGKQAGGLRCPGGTDCSRSCGAVISSAVRILWFP